MIIKVLVARDGEQRALWVPVGDVPQQQVDGTLVLAVVGGVELDQHGQRVQEVAVVEVVVVVPAVSEVRGPALQAHAAHDAAPVGLVDQRVRVGALQPLVHVLDDRRHRLVARVGVAVLLGDEGQAGHARELLARAVGVPRPRGARQHVRLQLRQHLLLLVLVLDLPWGVPGDGGQLFLQHPRGPGQQVHGALHAVVHGLGRDPRAVGPQDVRQVPHGAHQQRVRGAARRRPRVGVGGGVVGDGVGEGAASGVGPGRGAQEPVQCLRVLGHRRPQRACEALAGSQACSPLIH
mmetsp:Transcript_17226/g.27177  ORF Transcript_17226/g.27177 Transcript_17226/m.27177 type:complete len:292 (+) Transcript_17226:1070-1945(+)